jgi:hypothetical protein
MEGEVLICTDGSLISLEYEDLMRI